MTYFPDNITVEEGKENLLFKTKSRAFQLLQPFDWYVTRKAESDTAIPDNVVTYRQEVKAVSAQRCTLINACSSVDELEALLVRPYWDIATQFDTLTNSYSGDGDATAFKPWPEWNSLNLTNYTVEK
tara:strand:+ start:237 stop:617 length:381 start_codon:yes stop_codon:yes gene_type:complete